ncbi:hypothetical protein A9K97_gp050 [Tokyovirus A1]|uniref:hypothetical protein n=1 Tax=Tokyovirus A1 TaxID=1826170 RepID=UPI0007A980A5|nr:hypothetical protein A9K97_gp050 [Tokyovirus A1]BAU80301.1 hypothetical protein [Tokyovirus A1]
MDKKGAICLNKNLRNMETLSYDEERKFPTSLWGTNPKTFAKRMNHFDDSSLRCEKDMKRQFKSLDEVDQKN